ncbi:hypothetical protein A8709_05785 [Paenibacillus pectinilyticus]|uniref:Transcription regulator TrmB N-terminal domain-containing protein n=1 Tax=Paenibacillus pectinilyticus TaxID=512399 RepID=A0A1C0ZSY6_9BACL|nr:TrmB family transcriptional regulator [Paenibacillus pectinilyticus]OCT11190.1 hypothetical protein A8709_05785 [Paenibacillus pectinilyticus]
MENVLMHLKNLGFTDLEAKCLHVLAVSGTQTGYEIAKGLGVSRSNVYAALQKLAEKGAVLTSHGEPTVYQCVPIEEIGERIESELQASIRYVKEHLPKQDAHRSEYFSLEGDAKVLERVRSELKRAKEEVFCDLSPEEAKLLKDELRQAPAHGVRVFVAPTREAGVGFYPFARRRGEGSKGVEGREVRDGRGVSEVRKFTILIDRKLAIVGTRGGDEITLAMLTEHPAMVELLYHHFCSNAVLHELQQDMGAKLEDKYGKHFKKIIQKYIDGKVPESKRLDESKLVTLKVSGGITGGLVSQEVASTVELSEGKAGASKLAKEKSSDGKTGISERSEESSDEGKIGQGEPIEEKYGEERAGQAELGEEKLENGKQSESKSADGKIEQGKQSENKSSDGKSQQGKRKKKK